MVSYYTGVSVRSVYKSVMPEDTSEHAICHQCGQTINEKVRGYPTMVEACGGYDSNVIFDGSHYTFTLCEICLVKVMDGLAVPPNVFSEGDPVTWAEDRKHIAEREERKRTWGESHAAAIRDGVCATREDQHEPNRGWGSNKCCRAAALGLRNDEPVCELHMRDLYVLKLEDVTIGSKRLTWGDRASIGRAFLLEFSENTRNIGMIDRHEMHVAVSTLFSLLMTPTLTDRAAEYLTLLTGATPTKTSKWVGHGVAGAFPPGDVGSATANDWLTWGREQGYPNATAHAMLGRDAASNWEDS